MSPTEVTVQQGHASPGDQDLGPLAWVMDELRKSFDVAVKATRRFVREAEEAKDSDLAALDSSPLRMAKQQLHQAGGALEMVGLPQAALLLRAMESAVQHYVQHPQDCTEAVAQTLEKASFALLEFLETVLAGKQISAVALFPQYRDVQALCGGHSKVHPADLWPVERRLRDLTLPRQVAPVEYGAQTRKVLDACVLQIVKEGDVGPACVRMRELSLGFAQAQSDTQLRIFWKVAAAYFDAMAHDLIKVDVYTKRVASRVLMVCAALTRGEVVAPERLLQDMLFFCAQVQTTSSASAQAQIWAAVHAGLGLQRHVPVDYEQARFGRFDPAVLAQARKRIAAATEIWSALAGGDKNKLKPAVDQFTLVTESLVKLHPGSQRLAKVLNQVTQSLAQQGQLPSPAVAMEVATSVLYLQAAFASLDMADDTMAVHSETLAQRLHGVWSGQEPQPLEPWMEQLYRQVSDQQTMGSVVGELRTTLGEAEKWLDQYFRNTSDPSLLGPVAGHLSQMRGVLSVLGLDQASHAMVRMRQNVERLQTESLSQPEQQVLFEKMGNSLGALGFLIDMLSYQRNMARKLYEFDEEAGELKLLMGRTRARAAEGEGRASVEAQQARTEIAPQTTVELPASALIDAAAAAAVAVAALPDGAALDVPLAQASLDVPEVADSVVMAEAAEPALDLPSAAEVLPEVLPDTPALPAEVPVLSPLSEVENPFERDAPEAVPVLEPAPIAMPAVASAAPLLQVDAEDTDDELLGIFLEEAREVVANGRAALQVLGQDPADLSEQTTLRRAFHTLKGSSRMVGLDDFGQAGWAMEQMLNAWLAEQKGMPQPMQQLALQALDGFEAWAQAIEQDEAAQWQSAPFRASADAMRLESRFIALDMAAVRGDVASDVAEPVGQLQPAQDAAAQALYLHEEALPADSAASDSSTPLLAPDALWSTPQPPAPQEAGAWQPEPALAPESWDFSALGSSDTGHVEPAPAPAVQGEAGSLEEFDALLQAAGDGISAPILPPSDAYSVPQPIQEVQPAPQALFSAEALEQSFVQEPLVQEQVVQTWPVQEVPLLQPEPQAVPDVVFDAVPEGEATASTKYIGHLAIPMALFNVYLGEAESWSANLLQAMSDWQASPQAPQPEAAMAWAHSLAGSSATVGFKELSGLARLLENALLHVEPRGYGQAQQLQWFADAAQEIRSMLHRFAAGQLSTPPTDILAQLQQVIDSEDEGMVLAPQATLEAAPLLEDLLQPWPQGDSVPQQVLEGAAPSPSDAWQPLPSQQQPAEVAADDEIDDEIDTAIFRAMAMAESEDDDIDVFDVIDPDLFPIFEEEAVELLPALGGYLREWAAHPERMEARANLLRALHTLKGSARLAGAMRLGEMAHRLESALEALDVELVITEDIEPLFTRLDAMEASFNVLRAVGSQEQLQPVRIEPAAAVAQPEALPGPVPELAPAMPELASQDMPLPMHALAPVVHTAAQHPGTAAGVRQHVQQTVRVRSQLLDRLINEAGEVMIARSRLDVHIGGIKGSLADLTNNLERLRQQLRDVEVQAESQMQSRMQLSKEAGADFDPLEFDRFTRVQELTRMMAESVNDVATVQRNLLRDVTSAEDDLIAQGRQARELQRDLLRTRMVEFDSISERLYAVVRQTSKTTGKQVKLGLTGGTIEMDRGVLERMVPAFEHLLRNCVDHGIEKPQDRLAAGKAATGTINVHVQHEGNDVAVRFDDDGAGLNVARIRDKALAQGLIQPDELVDAARAAQLVFMPGFTTAEQLTGVSGRGIGMDVVRSEVQALGGRIETVSTEGQGSSFRLVLPLTTAVTQVVMLRAGSFSVGVPASLVEVVRRVSLPDLEAAYLSHELVDGDARIPFFWSGAVWNQSPRSVEPGVGKTRPVIIFRSAAQRIALHVDEVLGHQEVVVKNLGPQMARLPGLTGMSVLASGAVVLIYNPVALTAVYAEQIRQQGEGLPALLDEQQVRALQRDVLPQDPASGLVPSSQVPLVMVVDDSITVRRVSQRLLQREGYRVVTAADGLQALEKLQDETPCVVLSDIEMPRMDGFDLLRNIRAQTQFQQLPIIMITSRIAQKHRDHAMELGANHYLGKPYSDEELMGLVHHYAVGKPLPAVMVAPLQPE